MGLRLSRALARRDKNGFVTFDEIVREHFKKVPAAAMQPVAVTNQVLVVQASAAEMEQLLLWARDGPAKAAVVPTATEEQACQLPRSSARVCDGSSCSSLSLETCLMHTMAMARAPCHLRRSAARIVCCFGWR